MIANGCFAPRRLIAPLTRSTSLTTSHADPLSVGVRISDDLAATRLLYPRPLPTLPDILLIAISDLHAGASLPLNRYYPVMLETKAEAAEFEAFLQVERTVLRPPDLLDHRPSGLITEDIILARYAPPRAPWPWILLCFWPRAYTSMVPPGGDYFARQAFTTEVLATEADLEACERRLLRVLEPGATRRVLNTGHIAGRA